LVDTNKGCLAELNKAEIGLPGCTAFWNSFSCWAMLEVILFFNLLVPKLLLAPDIAVVFCGALGTEMAVT
jgi:hypothetical protein